jgi:ArsR family transcriptional regulator, arsenate/arsenite/antimonite-responsive transcriptional repressor
VIYIRQTAYNAVVNKQSKSPDIANLFSALADPTRLRLLNLMNGREVCVCYFVEILKQPQPKISRHLAYMRRAGIVSARREGKWMHYRISESKDQTLIAILDAALKAISESKEMKADVAILGRACCAPERFQLAGVPVPCEACSS